MIMFERSTLIHCAGLISQRTLLASQCSRKERFIGHQDCPKTGRGRWRATLAQSFPGRQSLF